jgi:hypothetical protein
MSDTATPSSPEEFRRLRKVQSAELLTLPSGLKLKVYRPSPLWWAQNRGVLPASLAARLQESGMTDFSEEELVSYSKWLTTLVTETVVEPGISLQPDATQIHPNDISPDDLTAIILYAVGETSVDGRSLTTFRREPGSDDSTGASGEGVVRPAESVA